MFNDANVKHRHRERVKGRVLVFTTSANVEFLETNMRFSYPLWPLQNSSGTNPDCGLTFVVELVGWLTFDEGAQVKILEVGPFVRAEYDPSAFALVRPADPSLSIIQSISPRNFNNDRFATCYVYLHQNNGSDLDVYVTSANGPLFREEWEKLLPVGSEWLGVDGYNGALS